MCVCVFQLTSLVNLLVRQQNFIWKTPQEAENSILCYKAVVTLFEKYSDGIVSTCVLSNSSVLQILIPFSQATPLSITQSSENARLVLQEC